MVKTFIKKVDKDKITSDLDFWTGNNICSYKPLVKRYIDISLSGKKPF